jgi:enoyl-CoA hydratase/carnithine racemase
MGFANRVVPNDKLESYVKDYAATIAGNAPLTIDSIKFIVGEIAKDESARDMAKCDAMVDKCFASSDYEEGRKAFMEKRKPVFTGK